MPDRIHEVINFWFGPLGSADLPTSDRTSLWFGEDDVIKQHFVSAFTKEYEEAIGGGLSVWEDTPRGVLALILLLDQYSRYKYKRTAEAFLQDEKALSLCLNGINEGMDHAITLIERVFFYMPLVHAEDSEIQEKSIRLFQELVTLSMPETTQIYQLFLAYSYAHFRVIKEFGRFPQRNSVLGRESTEAELAFLKNT